MKLTVLSLLSVMLLACEMPNAKQPDPVSVNPNEKQTMENFYNLKATTLDGEDFDFASLKGKRVLIVNTASECGYTPQYEQLQELYEQYGGDKFVILGFPSNDFGKQEPGSDEEIQAFCQKNYGVNFPMMTKNPVSGEQQQAVFRWLTDKDLNGVSDAKVSWNFNKFLVDENGKWIAAHSSSLSPLDERLQNFAQGI